MPLEDGILKNEPEKICRTVDAFALVEIISPARLTSRDGFAGVAQLVERLLAMQKAEGSSPFTRFSFCPCEGMDVLHSSPKSRTAADIGNQFE